MHEYKTYWIDWLQADPIYCNMRFKKLGNTYPLFEIDDGLIDEVEIEEFLCYDPDRIPFFIGSQFGIIPYFKNIPGLRDSDRLVAILNKSLLSGCVAGLRLIILKKDVGSFRIRYFPNTPFK